MEHWIREHWGVLIAVGAVGLPALVTGLSTYDETRSPLKAFIAFLSFLSHRNSPGTFKLPFTKPTPPEKP